jgi:hypothetical protein
MLRTEYMSILRKSRSSADFSQWSRESPWLALNRSIARGHMTVPRAHGIGSATDLARTLPRGQYRSIHVKGAQAPRTDKALPSLS